jgi:hypothetical protein
VIQVLTLDANAPVSEPKMAASAEMVAGFQYPPMNLIFEPYRKRASSPAEPQEGQAPQQENV